MTVIEEHLHVFIFHSHYRTFHRPLVNFKDQRTDRAPGHQIAYRDALTSLCAPHINLPNAMADPAAAQSYFDPSLFGLRLNGFHSLLVLVVKTMGSRTGIVLHLRRTEYV